MARAMQMKFIVYRNEQKNTLTTEKKYKGANWSKWKWFLRKITTCLLDEPIYSKPFQSMQAQYLLGYIK